MTTASNEVSASAPAAAGCCAVGVPAGAAVADAAAAGDVVTDGAAVGRAGAAVVGAAAAGGGSTTTCGRDGITGAACPAGAGASGWRSVGCCATGLVGADVCGAAGSAGGDVKVGDGGADSVNDRANGAGWPSWLSSSPTRCISCWRSGRVSVTDRNAITVPSSAISRSDSSTGASPVPVTMSAGAPSADVATRMAT